MWWGIGCLGRDGGSSCGYPRGEAEETGSDIKSKGNCVWVLVYRSGSMFQDETIACGTTEQPGVTRRVRGMDSDLRGVNVG